MEIKFVTEEELERFREKLLAEFKHILSEKPVPAPEGQGKTLWLKSYQVERLLGISTSTLQTFRRKGILPYAKVGGTCYYLQNDIVELVKQRKQR
jgi:hypothetical protein